MRPPKTQVWVPDRDKGRLKKRIDPTKHEFEDYDPGCLFAVDANGRCCGEPVKSLNHTIPNSAVLSPLSRGSNGKVMEVLWGFGDFVNLFVKGDEEDPIDLSDHERFRPKLVGIDAASCGRYACKNPSTGDHDGEFSLIDVKNPDFAIPRVAFLSQYRPKLYGLYQLKRTALVMDNWDQTIMRLARPRDRSQWLNLKGLLGQLLPIIQEQVSRLGEIWYTQGDSVNTSPEVIAGQQTYFRSKLTFAACLFYGRSSVASVFPVEDDLHQMGITNFVDDTEHDAEFTQGLVEIAESSMQGPDYGLTVIKFLENLSSGIIDMSPVSYEELSSTEHLDINRMVEKFAQADMLARNINSMLQERQSNRRR